MLVSGAKGDESSLTLRAATSSAAVLRTVRIPGIRQRLSSGGFRKRVQLIGAGYPHQGVAGSRVTRLFSLGTPRQNANVMGSAWWPMMPATLAFMRPVA